MFVKLESFLWAETENVARNKARVRRRMVRSSSPGVQPSVHNLDVKGKWNDLDLQLLHINYTVFV